MFNGSARMQAKMTLPKPVVHAQHPFKNQPNHQKLKEYIQQRLGDGKMNRDSELQRLIRIDKNVSGWMRLSDEDKVRQETQASTGIPLATEMNLPLAYVHLDDMMTFFSQTFSPNRGMFYHTGKPEEVGSASQIVTIMNNNAIYAGYFRQVLLGIYSLLKYNTGGFQVFWGKEDGPKIVKDAEGQDKVTSQLRWQGNKMEAIDKYNFLADSSVHPTVLHCEGEYAATIKTRSYYWLQNKASQGAYYNCDEALNNGTELNNYTYYINPPQEAQMQSDESGGTNWKAVLSASPGAAGAGFELSEIHIKLNPTEFGLIDGDAKTKAARSRYETWRFTLLNDTWIIDATYMNNVHGYLPFFLGVLNDDIMGTAQKSTAEILQPLQNFASSLVNTHVKANRKHLWGLTFYDPTMFDLSQIPQGEVAARVPMKAEAWGRDIRTGIWEPTSTLDTKQTLTDLESIMGLINQFFPTQSLPSQIASIDRAVDSQVAAVQQGANRRQQKSARLLDDSVFRNVRAAMYYNIIQYQPDSEEVTDFYTGKPVKIDLAALRNTDLPFIIGQGLKAIDRQAAAKSLQGIIFALIQAPQASQGIDLLSLIDYWTSMIDIDVDMKQFAIKTAAAAGQTIDPATGQLVPATGNAIQPATAPAAVTAPIYG